MEILAFFLGTIVGSALTAVLARLESGESWVSGRSRCPNCRRTLTVCELVPLLSWICQRGRCRGCRKPIAVSYPLIELTTGLLFAFGFALRFGGEPLTAFSAAPLHSFFLTIRDFFAIAILLVVFVFDLRHGLILDRVTLPAIAVLAVLSLVTGMSWTTLLIGLFAGAGFFGLQYFLSKGRWIGGGDIRLGGLMGVLLGWPTVLTALFIAYTSGALVGLGLIAGGRKKWGSKIPFGTFLSVGALLALYFGEGMVRWYAGSL